ncbi:MAG: division/cell wall cluster transcriptional repressor MraZ [Candidatus Geothermincolia bacterium]
MRKAEELFLGEFEHSLDEKGRVTLPAKFRDQLQAGMVLTYWMDCIGVFPRDEFEKLGEQLGALPVGKKEARDMRRVLFAKASEAIPDRQGRINIPANLRRVAGLDREVVIVGVRKYLEIWDRDKWNESIGDATDAFVSNAESLTDLGF